MEIKNPYKSRWFYGHGPNGKMIIDNNQTEVARIYGLNQGTISACLRGECPQHKDWRFALIKKPRCLKKPEKKVKPKTEVDARHMDTAVKARIRHLMADIYPQWCGVETDGYIFTR